MKTILKFRLEEISENSDPIVKTTLMTNYTYSLPNVFERRSSILKVPLA